VHGFLAVKLSVSKGEKIEIQKMLLDMDKGSPSLDIRNATVGMSGPVSGFPGCFVRSDTLESSAAVLRTPRERLSYEIPGADFGWIFLSSLGTHIYFKQV